MKNMRERLGRLLLALTFTLGMSPRVIAAEEAQDSETLETFKDDVNAGLGALTSRVTELENAGKLKFKGDIRVREEYFSQAQDSIHEGPIANRQRLRLRLRFGAEKEFGPDVTGGFRLASGENQDDPTSTNQTLQQDFKPKNIWLDQAWIGYSPSLLSKKVAFLGGKMINPLAKSPITWDDDTNPEGLALELKPVVESSLRAAYFQLGENNKYNATGLGLPVTVLNPGSIKDPYMTCFQGEFRKNVSGVDLSLTGGYTYVPWTSAYLKTTPVSYHGPNGPSTAILVDSNGMVGDASHGGMIPAIHMAEVILKVKKKIGSKDVALTLHGARNTTSFDLNYNSVPSKITGLTGHNNNHSAGFAQLAVGGIKLKGDWIASLEWGYIEPNAVFGLFSDSDSLSGYNNHRWGKLAAEYAFTDGLSVKLSSWVGGRVNYALFPQPMADTTKVATFDTTSRKPGYRTQIDFVVKL